jgi:hypothetical protein
VGWGGRSGKVMKAECRNGDKGQNKGCQDCHLMDGLATWGCGQTRP